ncbi:MAG: hypothetical protein AAFV43_17030, partial [Planctomycetota bacterium]
MKLPTDGATPDVQGLAASTTAVAGAATDAPTFAATATPQTAPPTAPAAALPAMPAGATPSPTMQAATTPPTGPPVAGPYDPNAFRGDAPADNAIASVAANLRSSAAETKNAMTQAAENLGSRYGNAMPSTDDLPDFSFAGVAAGAPASVGSRYSAATPSEPGSTPVQAVASTAASATPAAPGSVAPP